MWRMKAFKDYCQRELAAKTAASNDCIKAMREYKKWLVDNTPKYTVTTSNTTKVVAGTGIEPVTSAL